MVTNHIPMIAPFYSAKKRNCSYALASNTVRAEKMALCLQEQDTWHWETSGHLSEMTTTLGFKQEMVVNMVTSGAGRILNKVTVKLAGAQPD